MSSEEIELEQMAQKLVDAVQPFFDGCSRVLGTALIPAKVFLVPVLSSIHRLLCHLLLVRLSSCGPWAGAIPLIYITVFLLFVADPFYISAALLLISAIVFVVERIWGSLDLDGNEEEFLFGDEEQPEEEEERESVRYASLEMFPSSQNAPFVIKCTKTGTSHPVGGFHKHVLYNFDIFFINCHNMKKLRAPFTGWDEVGELVKCRELCLLFPFDEGWGNESTAAVIKAVKPEILNMKTTTGTVTRELAPPLTVLRQVERIMFSTVDIELLLCLPNVSVVSVNVAGAAGKGVVRIVEQWRAQERTIEWIRVVLSDSREIKKSYCKQRVAEKLFKVSRGDGELSILIESDHVVLSTIPFCP